MPKRSNVKKLLTWIASLRLQRHGKIFSMKRIKVAVLRGGPSSEAEVSMLTGKSVIENLPDKYIPIDVFISKNNEWHVDGLVLSPAKVFDGADVIFNALHGEYGEDGKIQQLLNKFGKKYTGSKALASAVSMNKALAKDYYKKAGIKTPVHIVIKKDEEFNAGKIFKTFPMPAIIKPNRSGSSYGISIVKNAKEIENAINEAFKYSDEIVIEEFISGREATCAVIEKFKGKNIYSLLPIEIIKPVENEFFDYDAKYSGKSREICPGNFSREESDLIQDLAIKAHEILGLNSYSRSDFIVHPKRGVYILETNSLPGLTRESLLPKALEAVGVTFPQFLDHVIMLAFE